MEYGDSEQANPMAGMKSTSLRTFTVRDRIAQQLRDIKQREKELLEFQALLDANPDTEKILNLSRQIGI